MATFRTTNRPTLENVYGDWLTNGGIFSILNTFDVPWKEDIDAGVLDVEYFGNVSGNKTVAPLVAKILSKDGGSTLSDARKRQLALIIYNLNALKWDKLWETFNFEYNPISNYDMTESETIDRDRTATGSHSQTSTHTGTDTDASTRTTGNTGTGASANTRNAFNSTTPSDTNANTTTATNTETETAGNTKTLNLTDGVSGTTSETVGDDETRTLTRSGNIGVTTSQQMIQAERDLWLWNMFYRVVFPDIDKTLTIATYSNVNTYGNYSYNPSGGGSTGEIIEKLNEIKLDIDALRVSTFAKIDHVDLNIDALRGSTFSGISSVNLNIEQLRASTFQAIDGVTTRNY